MHSICRPLPRSFFDAAPTVVAPALLGKLLVRRRPGGGLLRARIVETEAYLGQADPAAHAFAGLTPRTAILFGPPGHAYIYLIYGLHLCLNVSTLPAGQPGGVLFRAAEICEGEDEDNEAAMRPWRQLADALSVSGHPLPPIEARTPSDQRERPKQKVASHLSGPGRLTRGLEITSAFNGGDLTQAGALYLADDGHRPGFVAVTTRVGIRKAMHLPYRYFIENHPAVSRPRGPILARVRPA